MKIVRVLVVAALALFAGAVAPAAAQTPSPCAPGGPAANNYPPRDCGVRANQSTVAPGGQLTLTGDCPAGASSVNFRLQPGNVDLGSATPNPEGAYTKQVTIPSSVAPGNYEIVATCTAVEGNVVTRSVAITVAAATAGRSGTLPRTGASILPVGIAGFALLGVGAAAVAVTRRKRTAA